MRTKKEEHMLILKDKSTHEQHSSQPLQTRNKQFEKAINFLTGYNGIIKVTYSKNKVYFANSINDKDDFIQTTVSPGAYKIDSLNIEIQKNNF